MARTAKGLPTIKKSAEGFTRTPIEIGTGSKSKGTYQVLASCEVPQIEENAAGLTALSNLYAAHFGVPDGMVEVAKVVNAYLSTAEGNRLRARLLSKKATDETRAAALKAAPNTVAVAPTVKSLAEKKFDQIANEAKAKLARGEKLTKEEVAAMFEGLIG